MWSYRARLERDLVRWREAGWVSEAGADAIRRELVQSGRGIGLSTALAVLGAVLIGFAAMSFVAANWQDMPRIARLMLIVAALWGCYGVAGLLASRRLEGFAEAAVLAGVGLFGAGIMLVAQMYHIDGNPPDAVLTWAMGALLAGVLLRSNPALAAAMLLIGLWTGWQTGLIERVHWPFLLGWGAVAAAFFWRRWRPGLHLSAIVLSGWIIGNGFVVRENAHWMVALIGLGIVAASIAAEQLGDVWRRIGPVAFCYGMVIAFMGLFSFTFLQNRDAGTLALMAVMMLTLLLGAVYWGWHTQHKAILWLGYAGFSAVVLALYFETIGTLLGTSLFFLIAGLIVIALSWLAYRLHTRAAAAGEEVAP
jgi:uncharacterized membrane protein